MNVGTQIIQMTTVLRLKALSYSTQDEYRCVHSQLTVAFTFI